MSIAIVGIGQRTRGDDAAGLDAVAYWLHEHPDHVQDRRLRVEFCELPGLELIDIMENAQAVVFVDAVDTGSSPGSVHVMEIVQGDEFESRALITHGWGAAETIGIFRKLYPGSPPVKMWLVGIELAQIDLGSGLSPEVQRALPQAAAAIQDLVVKFLASSPRDPAGS